MDEILRAAPAFFLVAARVLAMVETAPLISSDAVPQIAKIALSGFAAFASFPLAAASYGPLPGFGLEFAALAVGEAMIGIIVGFFLTTVYAAFTTAGQFFSLQMGFGASETFDPLAQVEIPLIGQFLNLIAMLVFLVSGGFQRLFLSGIKGTFGAVTAIGLVNHREEIVAYALQALTALFQQALILSFPMLGTLFLVSVSMGLLSKASPQMNLLTEGFPISISVAWLVMFAAMPFMMEAFGRIVDGSFESLAVLFAGVAR